MNAGYPFTNSLGDRLFEALTDVLPLLEAEMQTRAQAGVPEYVQPVADSFKMLQDLNNELEVALNARDRGESADKRLMSRDDLAHIAELYKQLGQLHATHSAFGGFGPVTVHACGAVVELSPNSPDRAAAVGIARTQIGRQIEMTKTSLINRGFKP